MTDARENSITFDVTSGLPNLRQEIAAKYPAAEVAARSDLGGLLEVITIVLALVPVVYDLAKFIHSKVTDKSIDSIKSIIIYKNGQSQHIRANNLSPAEIDQLLKAALDGESPKR